MKQFLTKFFVFFFSVVFILAGHTWVKYMGSLEKEPIRAAELLPEQETSKLTADQIMTAPGIAPQATLQIGPRGFKGEKGDRGPRGEKGSRGSKGDTGSTGATGAIGPTGSTGADGADAPAGMEFLGSKKLSAGAITTGVLTIPARDVLFVIVFVASYGGGPTGNGDIASLRFNGDSSNNYWSRHLYVAAGSTLWINSENPNTTLIRLAESDSRLSRNVIVQIGDQLNKTKTINIKNQTGTNDVNTAGEIDVAGGEWINTTSQITSIEMLTASGANMGTGTGFAVYGTNF